MPRNNIKLLSKEQLAFLNSRYVFDLSADKEMMIVSVVSYDRHTIHKTNKPFSINCAKDIHRKITFSQDAIDLWIQEYSKTNKFSLFDVQQAVNILTVSYQTVNAASVDRVLNGILPNLKINKETQS